MLLRHQQLGAFRAELALEKDCVMVPVQPEVLTKVSRIAELHCICVFHTSNLSNCCAVGRSSDICAAPGSVSHRPQMCLRAQR